MVKGWDGVMGGSRFKSQCGQKNVYLSHCKNKFLEIACNEWLIRNGLMRNRFFEGIIFQ